MKTIPKDFTQFITKQVNESIKDEVERRVNIKTDAMIKFISEYMRGSLRKHKISEDRADKIVADLLGELESKG